MQLNKPELVIFCQNKLGGVQNFYRNLLEAGAFEGFTTKVIYTEEVGDNETKLAEKFNCADEEILFHYSAGESSYNTFRKLAKLVSKKEGVVFTNFPFELGCLQHHQTGKTVVMVVHDEMYIQNAIRYSFLIDVFVAHNLSIFHLLKRLMPDRDEDTFYTSRRKAVYVVLLHRLKIFLY